MQQENIAVENTDTAPKLLGGQPASSGGASSPSLRGARSRLKPSEFESLLASVPSLYDLRYCEYTEATTKSAQDKGDAKDSTDNESGLETTLDEEGTQSASEFRGFQRYDIVLNREAVEKKHKESLKEMAKTFKRHGFRAGKVPLTIVADAVGGEVFEQVVTSLLLDISKGILAFYNARVLGPTMIENIEYTEVDGIPAIIVKAVLQTPEIVDLTPLDTDKPEFTIRVPEFKPELIDEGIVAMGQLSMEFNKAPEERVIQEGDRVSVVLTLIDLDKQNKKVIKDAVEISADDGLIPYDAQVEKTNDDDSEYICRDFATTFIVDNNELFGKAHEYLAGKKDSDKVEFNISLSKNDEYRIQGRDCDNIRGYLKITGIEIPTCSYIDSLCKRFNYRNEEEAKERVKYGIVTQFIKKAYADLLHEIFTEALRHVQVIVPFRFTKLRTAEVFNELSAKFPIKEKSQESMIFNIAQMIVANSTTRDILAAAISSQMYNEIKALSNELTCGGDPLLDLLLNNIPEGWRPPEDILLTLLQADRNFAQLNEMYSKALTYLLSKFQKKIETVDYMKFIDTSTKLDENIGGEIGGDVAFSSN